MCAGARGPQALNIAENLSLNFRADTLADTTRRCVAERAGSTLNLRSVPNCACCKGTPRQMISTVTKVHAAFVPPRAALPRRAPHRVVCSGHAWHGRARRPAEER